MLKLSGPCVKTISYVCSDYQVRVLKFEDPGGFTARTRRNQGNDRAYSLVGKATSTGALFLGGGKVLRSLRHYLWTQNREDYAFDRLEERAVRRGSAGRPSFGKTRKGRGQSIQYIIGTEKWDGGIFWAFLNA